MSLKGVAAVTLGVVGIGVGCWYAFSPRVTDRDIAFKINRGRLVEANVESGVKMDALWPHIDYAILPAYLQETVIQAQQSDPTTIRSKEETRIYGNFAVKWEIDRNDPNIGNMYTDLNVDEIKDLEPTIIGYTTPAIIDTYEQIAASDINDDILKVGLAAAEAAQRNFDARNMTYIKIRDVVPSGTGLSPEANADLERIVSENRKKEMVKIQEQVAEDSRKAVELQTQLTIDALKQFRAAGFSEKTAIEAYQLQLLRDNNQLGTPGILPPTLGGALIPSAGK